MLERAHDPEKAQQQVQALRQFTAQALEDILGDRISAGHVNVKYGGTPPTRIIELHPAAHPIPDEAGMILVGNIDADAEMELIYSAWVYWEHTIRDKTSKLFTHNYVSAYNLDGSPWNGGCPEAIS